MRRAEPPAQVRIIGGDWKRTPLRVVQAEGLRPTPDRVRETLFNWLGQRLDGWRCLDCFAGTGALGFEAASRGAAEVVMLESDRRAVAALGEAKDRLRAESVRIVPGDALSRVRTLTPGFDLVFLDPPFGKGIPAKVLPLLRPLIKPGGLLYLEAESAADAELLPDFDVLRAGVAGNVHYHLLQYSMTPEPTSRSR